MISEHLAALAWYVALVVTGGLVFSPFWIAYGAKRRQEEIEQYLRRREREARLK